MFVAYTHTYILPYVWPFIACLCLLLIIADVGSVLLNCPETVDGGCDHSDSGVSSEEGKENVNETLFSPMYQFFDNSGKYVGLLLDLRMHIRTYVHMYRCIMKKMQHTETLFLFM